MCIFCLKTPGLSQTTRKVQQTGTCIMCSLEDNSCSSLGHEKKKKVFIHNCSRDGKLGILTQQELWSQSWAKQESNQAPCLRPAWAKKRGSCAAAAAADTLQASLCGCCRHYNEAPRVVSSGLGDPGETGDASGSPLTPPPPPRRRTRRAGESGDRRAKRRSSPERVSPAVPPSASHLHAGQLQRGRPPALEHSVHEDAVLAQATQVEIPTARRSAGGNRRRLSPGPVAGDGRGGAATAVGRGLGLSGRGSENLQVPPGDETGVAHADVHRALRGVAADGYWALFHEVFELAAL